jgi:predicted phosphodiesterase
MTGWELHDDSTVIGFAGDWHGNSTGVAEKMRRLSRAGVTRLMHVGDFALWPDRAGRRFLDQVNGYAEESGILIVVTPGNHEEWRYLTAAFAAAEGAPAMIRSHIVALPRGHRWTHRGHSFVSFGGAASIDFEFRRIGRSWWMAELPTVEEGAALAAGGHAEIMITHDSPAPGTPSVNRIRATPNGWSTDALAYADVGARRITAAWEAVAPDVLVHGHFHVQDAVTLRSGQRIVSLAAEHDPGNVLLLNLETMTSRWLEDLDD